MTENKVIDFNANIELFTEDELSNYLEMFERKVLNMEFLSQEEFDFFARLRVEQAKRNGETK